MKKFIIPVLLIAIGIACLSAFSIIGSEVDSKGFVQEPFGLLPLGYAFLLLGTIWLGSLLIKKLVITIGTVVIGIAFMVLFRMTQLRLPFEFQSIGFSLLVVGTFWSILLVIKTIKSRSSDKKIATA